MIDEFDPLDGPDTVPAQLAASALAYGDAIFLSGEDGERLSFAATEQLARRAAKSFMSAGVLPGDRVCIWAPNGSSWVIACLGLQLAGAVLVPLNTRFKGEEAAFVLERSKARILCTVGGFLDNDYLTLLRAVRGDASRDRPVGGLPDLERIVLLDGASKPNVQAWEDFLAEGEVIGDEALDRRIGGIRPEDLCDILYTSGTTGRPKGAMHDHRQALASARVWNWVNHLVPGDRVLIVNPFFHSFGYRAGWVSCLVSGMTAYPVAVFSAEGAMQTIAREKITVLPGAPTLFLTLLDHPARRLHDLSSLRIGATGSANIPIDLFRRAREDLGLDMVLTSYGLTEASAMVTSCRMGDDFKTIAETVGRPFPGVEICVIDPEGHRLSADRPGELLVRGFNVMRGYFEDPAATVEAVDADGWLHTGDVGVIDADGYLKIVDRLKDIVIVGGFNAYPAEIEHVLREAPGVTDVAVVAMPDARMGEVCAAFVVSRPGAALDEAGLVAWSRERLANFKVPRRFFAIAALPRTPLGKVQKFVLKQLAVEATDPSDA